MKDSQHFKAFRFGRGQVLVDKIDGSPLEIRHPDHGSMNFLLPEGRVNWHKPPARWGKGFVIVPGDRAGHWDRPAMLRFSAKGLIAEYEPLDGLHLRVERRPGERWVERYRFTNRGKKTLRLGSIAVSTPFADYYPSARECLEGCCHAHIWTGGDDAHVWALRMDGTGPGLGLRVLMGGLHAYSIESRDHGGQSNGRGNIYLHPTDAARNPGMLGGQSEIVLKPGRTFELAWELGWYESAAAFEKVVKPLLKLKTLASEGKKGLQLGKKVRLVLPLPRKSGLSISCEDGVEVLRASQNGLHVLETTDGKRRGRAVVLFHPPLQKIVAKRAEFLLTHHQARERGDGRQGAFLPLHNDTRLTAYEGSWGDWSDGRERLAMPLLLLHARRLGWGDQRRLDAAIDGFAVFARKWLIREQGKVSGSSYDDSTHRLYNSAWMAEFFFEKFRLSGSRKDLCTANEVLESYYQNGGDKFLAFIDCAGAMAAALEKVGSLPEADKLRAHVLAQADHFLALGTSLPAHEVNYEQSIVAPLILILQEAWRLTGDARYAEGIERTMPWLEAFAGTQPDVRLRHVPIRHWDGFWFGRERHWGDVFPHYWSVLSAAVYADEFTRTGELRYAEKAEAIFRANLVAYFPDGSASAAFIYPSCVNGNPTHKFDPLANDQDWALVWYLKRLDALKAVRGL